MKKKYLIIVPFLLLVLISQGQPYQKYNFTVFAEPQLTWLQPDSKNIKAGGSKLGFNGGLNFDNFFAENYALSTGVSINSMHGKVETETADSLQGYTLDVGDVTEYHLQYINIPIGLKFKTIEVGYTRFYAHLGLDTYINIKAEADLPQENEVDMADQITWYNLGYYIGGGIEYSIGGTTALVAGIAYNKGFIDIASSSDTDFTTGSFNLRLGILF